MRYPFMFRTLSLLLPLTATPLANAAESDLVRFIQTIMPAQVNKNQIAGLLDSKSLEEHARICDEIKANGNFLDFAKEMGLGNLKSLELSRVCLAYEAPKGKVMPGQLSDEQKRIKQAEFEKQHYDVGRLKQHSMESVASPERHKSPERKVGTISEEKKAAFNVSPPEKPVLKRVDLSKAAKTVVAEEAELKAAQVIVQENIEALSKVPEYEMKMAEYKSRHEEIQRKLKQAEDEYANMSSLVQFLREDLKHSSVANQLKVFKPHEHEKDDPEAYITAAERDLSREDTSRFDQNLKRDFPMVMEHQVGGASRNLRELREKQEQIRRELILLNEEMMRLGQ